MTGNTSKALGGKTVREVYFVDRLACHILHLIKLDMISKTTTLRISLQQDLLEGDPKVLSFFNTIQ